MQILTCRTAGIVHTTNVACLKKIIIKRPPNIRQVCNPEIYSDMFGHIKRLQKILNKNCKVNLRLMNRPRNYR